MIDQLALAETFQRVIEIVRTVFAANFLADDHIGQLLVALGVAETLLDDRRVHQNFGRGNTFCAQGFDLIC